MPKIAVIFHSRYGSTKKYAQWIAEAVGADIFERSMAKITKITSR